MSGPPAHGPGPRHPAGPVSRRPPVTPALAPKRARGNDADSEAAGRPSSAASIHRRHRKRARTPNPAVRAWPPACNQPFVLCRPARPRRPASTTRSQQTRQEQPLAWLLDSDQKSRSLARSAGGFPVGLTCDALGGPDRVARHCRSGTISRVSSARAPLPQCRRGSHETQTAGSPPAATTTVMPAPPGACTR
jgi:hypothetical protein